MTPTASASLPSSCVRPLLRETVTMTTLHYRLRFDSPAFLGDADQAARWRTPPFKALLRQWWRVAYAQDHGFRVDLAAMRRAEGLLFGHAWLDDDRDREGRSVAARRSPVRLRLDHWAAGTLSANAWKPLPGVAHPQVRQPVAADLYLGYGPVTLSRASAPTLKSSAAMQAGEAMELRIRLGDEVQREDCLRLARALGWMHSWGAVGGRSRNGWGSIALEAIGALPFSIDAGDVPTMPWQRALAEPWAQAIGIDERGPLVWLTAQAQPDWRGVMVQLAKIKIGLRYSAGFEFRSGPGAERPEARHWLSYPVTHHSVRPWERGRYNRIPNSLRFKVRRRADQNFEGVVFHMPASPPSDPFQPRIAELQQVWSQAHRWLDSEAGAAALLQRRLPD